MSDKEKWIKEVAKEINRSVSSLKKAIKDTGMDSNSHFKIIYRLSRISNFKYSTKKLNYQE